MASRALEPSLWFRRCRWSRLGALPIDPEIIISEQARLGASVAWHGRSYSGACEKLNQSELLNEIR
jgi:hypothetical protein